jgi:Fe-S cluster biogenesis protein NfuA
VTSLTQEGVKVLLTQIRDMLRADGYEMAVRVTQEEVTVSVVATEEACAECLVPADLMSEIIRDSLNDGTDGTFRGQVSIEYPSPTAPGSPSH